MNSLFYKILVIIIIFTAEGLMIFNEMKGAKLFSDSTQTFSKIFFKLAPILILGAIGLLIGYMIGFRSYNNIWIVSVISITSILILEPILAYSIFHQYPTRGALIGLILGITGFAFTLFY